MNDNLNLFYNEEETFTDLYLMGSWSPLCKQEYCIRLREKVEEKREESSSSESENSIEIVPDHISNQSFSFEEIEIVQEHNEDVLSLKEPCLLGNNIY